MNLYSFHCRGFKKSYHLTFDNDEEHPINFDTAAGTFYAFCPRIQCYPKAFNIFTLGNSNGTFSYSWPQQLKTALPNVQVFNISKSGRTIGFVNLGDTTLNSLMVIDENLKSAADFTKDRPFAFVVIELGTTDGLHLDAIGSKKLIEPVVKEILKH